MIRLILSRGPMLMAVYPFNMDSNEQHDKPVNKLVKPLIEDELGWDRVKKIFRLDGNSMFTKELQSVINVTVTGVVAGTIIGGLSETKNTVNNFIANNEATRFVNHFEARKQLQREVFMSFIKKGFIMARKLGMFCFMFSTVTTCTTAYRGKLAVENYMLGGFVTGLLNRMNLGPRASLVGAGLGTILGGVCGGVSVFLLYITGTTIDEILQAQHDWMSSRNEAVDEKIRSHMAAKEDLEEKKIFELNQQLRLTDQEYQESKKKPENPST